MTISVEEKPKAIKYIGIFLIVASAYTLISVLFTMMFFDTGMKESAYKVYPFDYSIAFEIWGLLFSAVTLFASVQFLKYKEWARKKLQLLTWIYIIEQLFFGAFYVYALVTNNEDLPPELRGLGSLKTIIVVLSSGAYLVGIVIAAYILKHLQGEKIKKAMIKSDSLASTYQST